MTDSRDWETPRFRMGYLWWGRRSPSPWDETAVSAFNQALLDLGLPSLRPDLKQWAVLVTAPGRFSNVRKRPYKGSAFRAFNEVVGPNTEALYCFLSSGSLETASPDFFAELSWTTSRQVAGTRPFRPPNDEPALGFASFVMDSELLRSSSSPDAFTRAVRTLGDALGPHRGGFLVDRPWVHDAPGSRGFGKAGPLGARLNLLALAPLRHGQSDLDTWGPPFDLPLDQ